MQWIRTRAQSLPLGSALAAAVGISVNTVNAEATANAAANNRRTVKVGTSLQVVHRARKRGGRITGRSQCNHSALWSQEQQ